MIVVRAPMRVSLFGGGTDIPAFHQDVDGAVFSMGINKYVYVMMNSKFGGGLRVSYSVTENVERVSEIRNELIRESLLHAGVPNRPDEGLEVVTVSDVPSTGSGLGASSSLAVALAAACEIRKHYIPGMGSVSLEQSVLARRACEVEIDRLGHPIGKQDQYGSALGGIALHTFHKKSVISAPLSPQAVASWRRDVLPYMMLLYFGARDGVNANNILASAQLTPPDTYIIEMMATQAKEMYTMVAQGYVSPDAIGRMLMDGWALKKRLTPRASNPVIDYSINLAHELGAYGTKVLGAGGGGFLMVIADPDQQSNIASGLGMTRMDFDIDTHGVVGEVF